jgi:ABC-type amino acid transport substrate-binding protein
MFSKRMYKMVLVLFVLSLLAACAPAAPQVVEKEVLVTVVVEKEGETVVVTATPEPTIEPRPVKKVASNVQILRRIYREGNEIKGYEYEIYKEALNRAGYDLEVVDVAFAGIFAGLQAEKWDMACSNIFITLARVEEMDFAEPFLEGYDVAVALKDGEVKSLDDFAGKIIGTETGTSQAAWLATLTNEYGPYQTQLYEDAETQWLDLETGRIDALTTSFITAVVRLEENPNVEIIANSEDNFLVSCALRKGDPLKAEVDAAIQSMKEDGTIAALFEKYFLIAPPADSAAVTVFTEPHVPTR